MINSGSRASLRADDFFNGRVEGGIVILPDKAGTDEVKAGNRQPGADEDLCDDQHREGDKKPGVRCKVQQERLLRRRPQRNPFDEGKDEQREPRQGQEDDNPPGNGRVIPFDHV